MALNPSNDSNLEQLALKGLMLSGNSSFLLAWPTASDFSPSSTSDVQRDNPKHDKHELVATSYRGDMKFTEMVIEMVYYSILFTSRPYFVYSSIQPFAAILQ